MNPTSCDEYPLSTRVSFTQPFWHRFALRSAFINEITLHRQRWSLNLQRGRNEEPRELHQRPHRHVVPILPRSSRYYGLWNWNLILEFYTFSRSTCYLLVLYLCPTQLVSDIETTLGPGQNRHNIRYLSQATRWYKLSYKKTISRLTSSHNIR